METSFSRLQIVFLLLMSVGISNHVLIIPHLLKSAGRDAWISILIAYAALIIWCVFLYLILKKMRSFPFQQWIKARIGTLGYAFVGGAFALFLIAAGIVIVFDTTKNVSIFFLPKTSPLIIIVSYLFLCYAAASGGLKTIISMSAMSLPFVWILGIGVSVLTSSNKDYGFLLPVFTEGITPDMRGAAIVVGGSFDLLMLLLLQHKMNKPVNYGMIFILLTMLIGLIIGPTIGSIAAFGPFQAENLRFPAFEQWRLVMIGNYISHVDFLAVFQLMAGSLVRTALIVHFITQLTGAKSTKVQKTAAAGSTVLIALPSLMMISDIKMQEIIHRYFYSFSLWFGLAMTIILFTLSCMPLRKDGTHETNQSRI